MKRRRSDQGNISEFAIALYIFLLIIAFPLIDLFGVVSGAAVLLLGAHQAASAAATQRRYPDCLASMETEVSTFLNGNFARFAKVRPVGGFRGCGADLFVDASSIVSGNTNRIGPNTPIPPPIDTSANIYEATVQLKSEVGPLMNLSFVPFLSGVPGLGGPALLTLSASRAVEYPRGLEYPSSSIASAGGALPTMFKNPTAATPPGSDGSGWNNPTIYEMIKAAGQTVLTEEVVVVQANSNAFTPTSITISPGQKIWIDTRSDGAWSTSVEEPAINANGYSPYPPIPNYILPSAPAGSLVGKIVGSGAPFFLGVDKFNYPPAGTGRLSLMINDGSDPNCYSDNTGIQIVRIVLVQ